MKKKLKTMIIISMIITLILGGLIFVNDAFLPASILWLSLTSFGVCYYIKDTDKKNYLILLNNSRDTGKDYMSLYDIRTAIKGNIDYTISRNYYIKNIDKYIMEGEILTLNKTLNTFHQKDVSNMKKVALDLIDERHGREER